MQFQWTNKAVPSASDLARRARYWALAGLLALSGCGGGGGSPQAPTPPPPPPPAAPVLQSVEITPLTASLAAGTSTQLAATAIYSDNSHADVTASVAWTSSDSATASVSAAGRVTGGVVGVSTLTATLNGMNAKATITTTPATVVSLALTPPQAGVAAGTVQQFVATGTFTDNTTQDVSADVSWSSSDPSVGTVSSAGLATGLHVGQTTISATCVQASMCGSLSATATLSVSAATLTAITISPASASIAAGTGQQFAATGTYTDQSTQTLTGQVSWSSSNPVAATINANGFSAAAAVGSTSIMASLGGISSAITLNVTPATLVQITITPVNLDPVQQLSLIHI